MAPVPQPFSFTGSLQLAADQSLPQDPIPFNFTSQFVSLQETVLNLMGAGTKAVDLGSIVAPGTKGLLIRYDAGQQGAAPLYCTLNGGSEPVEITPGGCFMYFNPSPVLGVTTLSIVYSAACQVRVWALG